MKMRAIGVPIALIFLLFFHYPRSGSRPGSPPPPSPPPPSPPPPRPLLLSGIFFNTREEEGGSKGSKGFKGFKGSKEFLGVGGIRYYPSPKLGEGAQRAGEVCCRSTVDG